MVRTMKYRKQIPRQPFILRTTLYTTIVLMAVSVPILDYWPGRWMFLVSFALYAVIIIFGIFYIRRVQFSMREVLIATTLVAIVLGILAYVFKQ
jgi:hypothetical protein